MVKLADVARAAGVSTASASRALARPELVSEDLRQRVVRVVEAQGYVPNAAARALSIRRSFLIGLVAGSMEDVVVRRAVEGFSRRLAGAGYGVVLAMADGDAEQSLRLCDELVARSVDALALVGVDVPQGLRERLRKAPLFLACLDQPNPDGFTAGFSRQQVLELSLRYLHELGHRRIGLVEPARGCRGLTSNDPPVGTDLTLERFGLADEGSLRSPLDHRLTGWLSAASPPSALVCSSDAIAAAVLSVCNEQGLEVPRRLSVIGLGDTQLAHWTRPPLTTLRVPAFDAGVAGADSLLAALRGEPYAGPALTARLVVRASTGPAL